MMVFFRVLSNPKVPVWGDGYGYGSCLMDYVPAVGKYLDEMVSSNNIPVYRNQWGVQLSNYPGHHLLALVT